MKDLPPADNRVTFFKTRDLVINSRVESSRVAAGGKGQGRIKTQGVGVFFTLDKALRLEAVMVVIREGQS